jgi:hypothetical protein
MTKQRCNQLHRNNMCYNTNYKKTPTCHGFNEVLRTEFSLPGTELQSRDNITCSIGHQNTVTTITICANDVVTRNAPPTIPHRTVRLYALIQT